MRSRKLGGGSIADDIGLARGPDHLLLWRRAWLLATDEMNDKLNERIEVLPLRRVEISHLL